MSMLFSSDLLNTFLVICHTRHVRQAAKQLHKAQSTVSNQIAMLENQAGLILFDRSRRPWELTEAGQRFRDFAEELSNKTKELARDLAELASGISGDCRIGATTSVGSFLLPPIVSAILQESPKLRFSVYARPAERTYNDLTRAATHFALVLGNQPPRGLRAKVLRTERFCFVTSANNGNVAHESISVTAARQLPFVMGLEEGATNQLVGRLLRDWGLREEGLSLRVGNTEGIKGVLKTGYGVGIVPHYTVARDIAEGVLREVRIKGLTLEANLLLVERSQPIYSPAVESVKRMLEQRLTGSRAKSSM